MKILIVGPESIHVSSFVDSLSQTGEDLYLLSEDSCDGFHAKNSGKVNFRSLNPLSIIRNYRILKEQLKRLRPDVVHIHQVNRLAYFTSRAASKLCIPIVTTAWGSDVLLIPFKNFFFHFLTRKSLERSNCVTADAHTMIEAMQKVVASDEKYELLQYGIDRVPPAEKEKLIYSNRLHKSLYRIDKIINYFTDFKDVYSGWKLVIAGEGIETEKLKEQAEKLKIIECVQFVGWLNPKENREWYAKASIYVSIPESDGTSVSVLEAMSAGCIPVLSDLPVTHEWIQDGVNGIIEKEGENPLIRALSIDSEKCNDINLKNVLEKASRENCTKRFIELYYKAIKSIGKK